MNDPNGLTPASSENPQIYTSPIFVRKLIAKSIFKMNNLFVSIQKQTGSIV